MNEEIKKNLKLAIDAEDDNRKDSIADAKFENGEQWDQADLDDRKGRPTLTINKVAGVVKLIIGEARQNNLSIKVRPVDSESDPAVAEVLTGLIRNIENISNAETAYDNAFECAARAAFGYWRIITDYADEKSFEQDILIKRIVNQYSVYYDPSAVEPDLTDARWCIITQTMSKEDYESKYPDNPISSIEEGDGDTDSGWWTEDEIRVAEYFKVVTKKEKLLLLEDGRTVKAAEVDEENLRAANFIKREREAEIRSIK